MTHKNIPVCLLFLILFTFSLSSPAQKKDDYSLLWRIEGNGLENPSYLFGTMHVKDARAFDFSDSVLLAIKKCDFFALEVDPDSLMNELFNKYFEDGEALRQFLAEDEYEELNERLKKEKGYDLDKMNVKNPRQLRFLLSPSLSKPDDKQTFVDAYLFGIAKTFHKKVFGLEDVKDQTNFLSGSSKEKQRKEILEILESGSDSYRKNFETMIDIYGRGNIEEIQGLITRYGLVDSIMVQRNRVMTNSLTRLMKESPTFAAVGCAHLPGENGVIDMLKKEGYTVKRVDASFTGVANTFKIDPLKMEWHTYRDNQLGFELKAPGKLIPADLIPGLNMLIYPDLTTEHVFFMMTIDMRGSNQPISEDELIKKMVNNYKSSNTFQSVKKKNITKNGLSVKEITGKKGADYAVIHLMMHNNIVYCQFVTHKQSLPDQAFLDHFFNSFKTFKPLPKKQTLWNSYKNEPGAFSARLPAPPKETHTTQEEFVLHLSMSTDLPNMTNYIVVYNDYPLGYYLENQNEVFNILTEEYGSMGELLSAPDTIWLDGYEGREYKVMLANKYYTICRVYVRGNRVYKVIQQNLNEGERKLHEDDFLSSFSLTPFEETELVDHTPENENFRLKIFPEFKVTVDSTINHSSYYNQTTSYVLKDPKSGGVYFLEYSSLNDYFKINNIDTFYHNMASNKIIGWSDSLINISDVTLDGVAGKEVFSLNKYSNKKTRHRIWLDDKKFFYMAAYVAEEALFSEASNTFFNSYKRPEKLSSFDMYASKAEKILKDVSSNDSSTYEASLGALEYYEFTQEDIPLIYQALNTTYADDSLEGGRRYKMIEQLALIDAPAYLEYIKTLYKDEKTTDALKTAILIAAKNYEGDAGMKLFLELFINQPPNRLGSRSWELFRPFSDSLELTEQHINKLLSLLEKEEYRSDLLSLFSGMANTDSSKAAFVRPYFQELTKFALNDLNSYINSIDPTDNPYFYDAKVFQYLNLANNIQNKPFTDAFTGRLLDSNIRGWMRTQAITARIFNDLKTDKKEISSLLESLESRYSIIKALQKANKAHEVPKKYRTQEEFARLCFYETMSYGDEVPDKIKVLGHIIAEGSKVYVFSFSYEYDEDEKYIGLSGFYPSSQKTLNNENLLNFEDYLSYTPWEPLEKDWKKQAKRHISDLKENGY